MRIPHVPIAARAPVPANLSESPYPGIPALPALPPHARVPTGVARGTRPGADGRAGTCPSRNSIRVALSESLSLRHNIRVARGPDGRAS